MIQVAIVAGTLAIVALGGYAGLVAPKYREIKTLRAQLAREQSALPGLRQPPRPAPPITEEERRLWGQLEARLRERFPAENALPGAAEAVAELARSARMQLVTLKLETPKPETPEVKARRPSAGPPSPPSLQVAPPFALNPTVIRLTVFHRYSDLVRFLDGLDRLPVFVAVESMEVKREENRLSTEMALRTLRWEAL